MKDIIKSQWFQIRKERFLYVTYIVVFLLISILLLQGDIEDCGTFICEASSLLPQFSLLFLFTAVGVICCRDFNDQTCNYEIMSGHTRGEIYMGRVVIALFVGIFGALSLCFICIGIGCILFGWGDTVSLSGVMERTLLMVFPLFRIACETIFLAFIVRNVYAIMAAGYLYVMVLSELLFSVMKDSNSFVLGFSNLIRLSNYNSFATYSPVTTKNITVYDASLGSADIIGTIGWSCVVGVLFLILGYAFFKTDDIR